MPDYDFIVRFTAPADPDKTFSNTLHFQDTAPVSWSDNVESMCADLEAVYQGGIALSGDLSPNFTILAYNPDDEPPRQPFEYEADALLRSGTAPSEVALCLSYYSERNLPRQRGRIYLGPLGSGANGWRPSAGLMTAVLDFGSALADMGGANIQWQQVSPTTGVRRPVSDVWVDNAWDTQRRRGVEGTDRQTRSTGS